MKAASFAPAPAGMNTSSTSGFFPSLSIASRPSTSHISSTSSLLRPRTSGISSDVVFAEEGARREFASRQRTLLKFATQSAKDLIHVERSQRAKALRAEYDEETGKAVRTRLRDVAPATEAQVVALSKQLNAAMCKIFPDGKSQASYFRLFKHMDADNSGLVAFDEFVSMVRTVLKLPPSKMKEKDIEAAWRWVDEDASGMVAAGEFLRLMRKGWEGFLEEQDRLAFSMARRPSWNPSIWSSLKEPPWAQQAVSVAEQRRQFLEEAEAGAAERTRKLHEAAKRFEEQERAWKVRLSLPAQGATTGMSRRSSSKRLLSSASTASLGM